MRPFYMNPGNPVYVAGLVGSTIVRRFESAGYENIISRRSSELVAYDVNFESDVTRDRSKPNGTPRKLLDVSRLHELGRKARIELRNGIEHS